MYDFIDQPVERLCNGGRFVLWGMRAWAQASSRGTCPPASLSCGFAGMGVLGALADFHLALTRLDDDALEKLELAPMGSPRIGEHEAVLTALWRDAARGETARLEETLALLVDGDAVAPLAGALSAATAKFARAGLDLTATAPLT